MAACITGLKGSYAAALILSSLNFNKMSLEIKIINNSTLGVYKIYKILE